MSRPFWAVLAPGEAGDVEARARAWVDAPEDGPPPFTLVRGGGRYHAVHGTARRGIEGPLAAHLAEAGLEPVYALTLDDEPLVLALRRGGGADVVEEDPEDLARRLGCPIPPLDEAAPAVAPSAKMRAVARIEGVDVAKARRLYEAAYREPPPRGWHFDAVPGGVILWGDHGDIGFADVTLSERLPKATVFTVTASPSLHPFMVQLVRGGEPIGHFDLPARSDPFSPALDEVKGAREPAAILAALGIPAALFTG